jgi:cytochrome c553
VNKQTTKRPGTATFLVAMMIFAVPAAAEGDAEQGKQLGFTCMGCHGIEGYRNAYPSFRVPRLGGQQGAYIKAALRAYREGTRPHPTMKAHAAALTDQDIENLVAWITSVGDARDLATAESAARVTPAAACISCHGRDGEGVIPQPPTLAGQQQDYIEYALHQYKDGSRSGTVMSAFTASLNDADIALLAKYYSSQDGLKTLQQ